MFTFINAFTTISFYALLSIQPLYLNYYFLAALRVSLSDCLHYKYAGVGMFLHGLDIVFLTLIEVFFLSLFLLSICKSVYYD
jgi:hypothetical protein